MQNLFMQPPRGRAVAYRWLVLLSLLWAAISGAEDVTLTCNVPTTNTDGSALTDLAHFNFYYGQTAGGPYPDSITQVPDCNVVVPDLAAGNWYFVATAVNDAGVESDFSNEATATVVTRPDPPTNLTVVAGNLTAYGLQQSFFDVITLFAVGTVPEGTPCDSTMSVNGRYRVDVDRVNYAGTVRPAVVFAECEGS